MSMVIAALFGPVSSASPNGQGPLFSWLLILVGGYVAVTAWRHYLKRRESEKVPMLNLLGVSAVCGVLVVVGLWSLVHSS
jgi:hypothetical protein